MIKNKSIEWIFFDAGGVLLDETQHEQQRMNLIFQAIQNYKPEITRKEIIASRYQASAELGGLTENIIKIFLSDEGQIKNSLNFIHEKWDNNQSTFVKSNAKVVVSKLSEKYHLGLLANQPIKVKEKLDAAGVLKFFKFKDVSEDIKLRKPDTEFFNAIFRATGANPIKSVIIDDNIERGLIPAKKLSMITVWFKLENRDIPKNVVDYSVETLDDLLDLFF